MVVDTNGSWYETGNLTTWLKYRDDYIVPLNKMFRDSKGVEFTKLREKLQLKVNVMTEWESWGICEICGRPQGQGRRRRKGSCRLKMHPQFKDVGN